MPFRLLPVKPEDRQHWVPKPPPGIGNSSSDYVSYKATGEGADIIDVKSAACYVKVRPNFDRYHIICRPKQLPKKISLDDAYEFFNIMTEHGVVPEGVKLWEEEEGIFCEIPKGIGNPHNVYTTLTCYRWLDAHPRLVWEFLRIMKQPEERHPFQILPFLISKNVSNCNHSFITTNGWKAELTPYETALNPTLGLSAKIYFDPKDPRGKKDYGNPAYHVNASIGGISRKIAPKTQVRNPGTWGPGSIESPKYQLEKEVDGLHPALYELYTIPNITTEQIDQILGNLFTKEKK